MSDRFSLAGDVAVVTGAARGLGKAIATAFAEEGAHVILADVSPDVDRVPARWAMPAPVPTGGD